MFVLVFTIHSILCAALIVLVLVQQGKGADMGAAFGGGSNTLFGAGGAADFITKLTTGLAIAFMVTSILLVRAYSSMGFAGGTTGTDPLTGSVMEREAQPAAAPVEAAPPPADAGAAAAPVVPPVQENKAEADLNAKSAAAPAVVVGEPEKKKESETKK